MTTAGEFDGDLSPFLAAYEYQPDLTRHLDASNGQPIDQARLNEIVLWKLSRYVHLTDAGQEAINTASGIQPRQHRSAEPALRTLLDLHGVDLPMASTILRFANAPAFQIIDRHAYRAVFGANYPLRSTSPTDLKVATYFTYLDRLHDLCDARQLDFTTIDRLLYIFDKQVNGPLTNTP